MAEVVRVVGPDASAFLQGQLSQDIDGIAVGDSAWSFVLEPNGHINALVKVSRVADDEFALMTDDGLGARVEARLRKFLLRTKATIAVEPTSEPDDDDARVEAGRPGAAEFDERAVPAETGWVDRAVSFTKGCYTGQELVARMDSRTAEPPRRLVRLSSPVVITPGASIEVDGAEVGTVTSAAGGRGLGYVKRGTRLDGPALVDGHDAVIEGAVGA